MNEKTPKAGIELHDIWAAFSLLSRLSTPVDHTRASARAAHAVWAYPLVGATLGLIAGLIGTVALWLGAPDVFAALCALTSLVILSGGMHEDGLADCADGFGGAYDIPKRLEIMKDSRIGVFAAVALILFLGARASSLTALSGNGLIYTLITVGAVSRLPMALALYAMPNVRSTGLSASVGKPPELSLTIAIAISLVISLICMGFAGVVLLGWALIGAIIMGIIAQRSIGGQTGDVLGAMQQWAEVFALAAAVAALN